MSAYRVFQGAEPGEQPQRVSARSRDAGNARDPRSRGSLALSGEVTTLNFMVRIVHFAILSEALDSGKSRRVAAARPHTLKC
jgi:hypothetical protein